MQKWGNIMNIEKFEFEKSPVISMEETTVHDNSDINEKYDKGYSRVVTENGSYKVALIKDIFLQPNYNLHPDYQRRITWNTAKRSKLIESLIVNIPIPPIFLYEYDYDKYEIMDGLQRISTIIAFYNNEFRLTGLEEWSELNGKNYKGLPEKIREGIDRRQLQVITLLKESAQDAVRAEKIKRLVFERLNTGGVKLQGQEIRNAIYNGLGNQMCIKLSELPQFRTMWNIPIPAKTTEDGIDSDEFDDYQLQTIEDEKVRKKLERHSLYKRMYDVELILRFFAMRYVDDFCYSLSDFLDDTLISLNKYTEEQLESLQELFITTLQKAYDLFGDKAFMYYDGEKWSAPAKMIYDPLMQVLTQNDLEIKPDNIEQNIEALTKFYESNSSDENPLFDGKHQSKDDIIKRMKKFDAFIRTL